MPACQLYDIPRLERKLVVNSWLLVDESPEFYVVLRYNIWLVSIATHWHFHDNHMILHYLRVKSAHFDPSDEAFTLSAYNCTQVTLIWPLLVSDLYLTFM